MIYVIDTNEWEARDVELRCRELGVEFKGGFGLRQTSVRLASHMLKREIASEYGVGLDTLVLGPHGKPEFENTPVHFNISHHESIALAVTSISQPVGIDITQRTAPFTSEQSALLYTQEPPRGMQGVFWAAREAYLKYTGEGVCERALKIQQPAHTALPNLLDMGPLSVMPLIRVENQFARLFKIHDYVGAAIALKADLDTVHIFSNEKQADEKQAGEKP